MDSEKKLEKRKRRIKKKYFSTGAFVMITILGIIGVGLIYFSLKNIFVSKSLGFGMAIIVGLFFTLISVYCWILYFLNIILKPHKDVLFLKKIEHTDIYFIDKKGKRYNYDFGYDMLEEGYYNVLKTHNYIYDVLKKTNDTWTLKEKNNYFFNMYTVSGNFEGVFLLPIIYLTLIIGLFLFIMGNGFEKLYSIPLIFGPLFVIIYDLIYKIKLKKSETGNVDDTNLIKISNIFQRILSVVPSLVFCIIVSVVFINLTGAFSKLIFLPFLFCGYCTLGYYLAIAFQNNKLAIQFLNIFYIIFLVYWFGFLIVASVISVIQNQFTNILFTIPFWVAGIFMLYKYFTKK